MAETAFDPTALATALPPNAIAVFATDGSNGLNIIIPASDPSSLGGMSYQTQDNPAWFAPVAPATTPEEQLAYTFFQAALQQSMGGDAYAAAVTAGTLPSWSSGASLPD